MPGTNSSVSIHRFHTDAVLAHNGSYSTDLAGVNRILGGAMAEDFPTEETFKSNVYSKLIGRLWPDSFNLRPAICK